MILNEEKQSFSPKIRNKTRMFTLMTFIQHSTRSRGHRNQTTIRNKRIQISKEEVILSLFADKMILYKEKRKGSTKNLL